MHVLLLSCRSQPARADLLPDNLEQATTVPEQDYVKDCAFNLLEEVGKIGTETEKLPDLYRRHSANGEQEFLEYMFSIMYVESGFNRKAVSHADAYGLMQMTRVAVEEAVRNGNCNLRPLGDMNKLHDSVTNVKYGTCFLKKINDEVGGDWKRTLILYNGGYTQLTRYNKGDSIASETANYVLKVERALLEICRKPREIK